MDWEKWGYWELRKNDGTFWEYKNVGEGEVGYCYKNWISNQFTDEKEVEYCPKDSIEEDSSEVLHEDPVVQGVGGLLTPFKVTVCSIFSIAYYTYKSPFYYTH